MVSSSVLDDLSLSLGAAGLVDGLCILEDVTGLLLTLLTVSMVESFMRRTAAVVWV